MCRVPLRKGKTKRLIRAVKAADAQAAVRVQAKYMNKQPKFFCENCNAEVRRDAVICPHCGRFFASVRCPSCGFTGTHKEFKDGCPSCGYAFTPDEQENKKNNTKKLKKKKFRIVQYVGHEADARTDTDPLPLWVYGVVLLLCAALAIIFFLL
jgi:hypothetical protein